jgi:hypothetical protein
MPETYAAVLGLLQLLAGSAGWLGSWLFDLLRELFPRERCRRWPRWLAALLWEPHAATISAPALGAALAWAAGLGVALLREQAAGGPLLPALDTELAAGVTAVVGWLLAQARHAYETRRQAAQGE